MNFEDYHLIILVNPAVSSESFSTCGEHHVFSCMFGRDVYTEMLNVNKEMYSEAGEDKPYLLQSAWIPSSIWGVSECPDADRLLDVISTNFPLPGAYNSLLVDHLTDRFRQRCAPIVNRIHSSRTRLFCVTRDLQGYPLNPPHDETEYFESLPTTVAVGKSIRDSIINKALTDVGASYTQLF